MRKVSDEEDTISAVFADKDSNYFSLREIMKDNEEELYYVCKKMRLRRITNMLTGKVYKDELLPVGSDKLTSSYCFCSEEVNKMHMPNYKGDEEFDGEWFGCDGCGHWCHAQCMVKEGLLNAQWYEEYKDLKSRFGGSIPEDHSIYSDDHSKAYLPRCVEICN